MRFRSQLTNVGTFASKRPPTLHKRLHLTMIFIELAASLNSLGKVCWVRLERETVHFTIIPDQGTQVWAVLPAVS
jgi:HUS1 checkpoint protein